MDVIPFRIPAIEFLELRTRLEIDLFVYHRLAVGRPRRVAQAVCLRGRRARGIVKALQATALYQVGNVGIGQELRRHLAAGAGRVDCVEVGLKLDRHDFVGHAGLAFRPVRVPRVLVRHRVEDNPLAVRRPFRRADGIVGDGGDFPEARSVGPDDVDAQLLGMLPAQAAIMAAPVAVAVGREGDPLSVR